MTPRHKGIPKPNKYRAKACWWCLTCDVPYEDVYAARCGKDCELIRFDSKRELARWGELLLLERAGKIKDLQRQVEFPIKINGKKVGAYRCDFHYLDEGHEFYTIEDVKGVDTPLSKFKRKCVTAQTGTEVRIVR